MKTQLYDNPIKIQEFLWHSIKDLPKESLQEILSYVVYVRRKNSEPEIFNVDYEMINEELTEKSNTETLHLEMEFENYKTEFPHE